MARNIRLAFRNIRQYIGLNSINVIGLAIGILAVLLISQYITFEKSYDRHLSHAERLHRLVFYRFYQTGLDKSVGNNYYIGQIAHDRIPEIENFCRCKKESQFIQADDRIFKEERTLFADSSFFEMFSHEVISGDQRTFLRSPDAAVITESVAQKYFGNENPVGKIIYAVNPGKKPLTIQGVIRDVPRNSHLRFDIVIPLASILNKSYCFSCNNTNTYFLLKEGSDRVKIANEITSLAKENFSERNIAIDFPIEFHLQQITDIHLHSNYRFEFETNGNNNYLIILSAIVVLIILSAGMNFFNLFFSIAARRINGIGIRIINGASRKNVLAEFTTEALLTGLMSIVLAFIMLVLLFPVFRDFLNFDFTLNSVVKFKTWFVPVLSMILLSALSGWFLGLKLFRLAPVSFIKKDISIINRRNNRRYLFAGQFVISIILIGSAFGALKQINYMKKEAFTMNIDQTIVVKTPSFREFNQTQKTFRDNLLMIPGISAVTYSTISPGEKNGWVKGGISIKGKEMTGYQIFQADVAPGFFRFFNVRLIAGRQFFNDETNWAGGPRHLILNKEAALAFDGENINNLIGKTLYDSDNKEDIGEVVGIIDGYFQNSLDQEIKPTIFNCDQNGYYVFIKATSNNFKDLVERITSGFKTCFKDQYFEYYFLDDFFNSQYKSHIQLFRCLMLFSIMAVLITCLSLFGLVMISSVSRTKEIGIRKLNGAGISEILFILNKEFISGGIIAFIIAEIVTWIALKRWLQSFAYRTELTWWIFVLTGLIAFGIILVTVSWQSWRAATRNPVEALRYE